MSFDSIADAAARKLNKSDKPDKISVNGFGLFDIKTNALIGSICGEARDLLNPYQEDEYASIGDYGMYDMLIAIVEGDVVVKKFSLIETK